MAVRLRDLPRSSNLGAIRDRGLNGYTENKTVASLGWPAEVVRQWLYEQGQHVWFISDYGTVNLSAIRWELEDALASDLQAMPTGPSEAKAIGEYAAAHRHYLSKRSSAIREAWEISGTWIVPPLLIARELLNPPGHGLQVLEGRTRVGILRGRMAEGLNVAAQHAVWVGRRKA